MYEKAKSSKDGDAKLKGLNHLRERQPVADIERYHEIGRADKDIFRRSFFFGKLCSGEVHG